MADNDRALVGELIKVAGASLGRLTVRETTTQRLGTELHCRLPVSRNPVLEFLARREGRQEVYVAYTLLVDGRRRVASRVEALGGALAASDGRLFEKHPFLIIYDYAAKRALAVSCAALFGRFHDESKIRAIPSSSTATFSLTPSFDNSTISMYALVAAPNVWSVDFDSPEVAAQQMLAGLEKVRSETNDPEVDLQAITTTIQARISGDMSEPTGSDPLDMSHSQDVADNTSSPISPWKEELDASGGGSGVEAEEDDGREQSVREPFDPDEIEVQTRQITIDLLLSRLRHKAIDLDPEFQRRRGIWTDQRQSRLIESILLKIPLPTLYAAEDKDENWVIVDGIQRLTAIARFASPEAINDRPLRLSGLEYLGPSFADITIDGLDARLRRRLLETELVLHVIRYGTPDAVKDNIFARINTGGIPLSRQELRHALIPGQARKLLKDWAESTEFLDATTRSVSPERMNDRELVLRFVTFSLFPAEDYASRDFDRFLGEGMRRMNTLDESAIVELKRRFKQSLSISGSVFGDRAFRKQYQANGGRFPVNKALFEVVTVTFSRLSDEARGTLVARKEGVVQGFINLMQNREFETAISQGTGDVRKVRLRFSMFRDMVAEVIR